VPEIVQEAFEFEGDQGLVFDHEDAEPDIRGGVPDPHATSVLRLRGRRA